MLPYKLLIPFAGGRARRERFTWAQSNMWDMHRAAARAEVDNMIFHVSLPSEYNLTYAKQAIRLLVERHEVLRTRFVQIGDTLEQVVLAEGEMPATIYSVNSLDDCTLTTLWHLEANPRFSFDTGFPVRFSVINLNGHPRMIYVVASHVALDYEARRLLSAELESIVNGRELSPTPSWAPIDQTRYESGTKARLRSDASIAYWVSQLQALSPESFRMNVPQASGIGSVSKKAGSDYEIELRSRALNRAVRVVASRSGISPNAVILAAVGKVFRAFIQSDAIPVRFLVGNRFDHRTKRLVACTVMNGLCVIRPVSDRLPHVAQECSKEILRACRYAYYDPADLATAMSELSEKRGFPMRIGILFNGGRWHRWRIEDNCNDENSFYGANLLAEMQETTINLVSSDLPPDRDADIIIQVSRKSDMEYCDLTGQGHTGLISVNQMERILLDIESLAVDAI